MSRMKEYETCINVRYYLFETCIAPPSRKHSVLIFSKGSSLNAAGQTALRSGRGMEHTRRAEPGDDNLNIIS